MSSSANIIQFRIPPEALAHLDRMMREAGYCKRNEFAKSLLLDVIADDRAAHEQPQREAAE